MKKNFDGEKVALILVVMIILAVVIFIVYQVFSSNKNLLNNNSEDVPNISENNTTSDNTNNNSNNNNNNNNNNNENSNENQNNNNNDTMNVDPSKIDNSNTPAPVEEQIATFSTSIYDKDQNRVDNITLANSKLNGTIVKKGEEFSFNNTIGPMNEAQGFKKALGFDTNGNKIQISGGGLCQISSTLYNAALLANLQVTERHPHSRRVYYVPKDKDATIVYGTLDFKFINNTDKDIKIEATNDNTTVTITLKKI